MSLAHFLFWPWWHKGNDAQREEKQEEMWPQQHYYAFHFLKLVLFLPPCRPLAWQKLRGTDFIYVVGNESKWKFRQEGTSPFHNTYDDCSSFRAFVCCPLGCCKILKFLCLVVYPVNIEITFWLSSIMLQQAMFFIYFFTDSRQFLVLMFFIVKSIHFAEIQDFSASVLVITQKNAHHFFCLGCSIKSCIKTGRPEKPICHLVLTNKLLTYFGPLSWQRKVLMLRSNTAQ